MRMIIQGVAYLVFIVFLSACTVPIPEREPYIGTVNGEYMSLAVYMLYLEEQIELFEREIGTDIWSVNFGFQTAEQVAMEHALENMALSLIIRNIALSNNISLDLSNLNYDNYENSHYKFFLESIAIREALMAYLTISYAEDYRNEAFSNMENAWLANAVIIRNIAEWDKIGVER